MVLRDYYPKVCENKATTRVCAPRESAARLASRNAATLAPSSCSPGMGHDLVERFAEELQNLSPFERRAALSELEALLHTNGIEASLRRRSTTALVIGAVLAVVVVRVVANRATFGGISASKKKSEKMNY